MPRFRRKPIEVEAILYDGNNFALVKEFTNGQLKWEPNEQKGMIPTSEGDFEVRPGDWVVKEPRPIAGRTFYPIKGKIFEDTYELLHIEEGLVSPSIKASEIEAKPITFQSPGRAMVWVCQGCGFIGMYKPENEAPVGRSCPSCGAAIGYSTTSDICLFAIERRKPVGD